MANAQNQNRTSNQVRKQVQTKKNAGLKPKNQTGTKPMKKTGQA